MFILEAHRPGTPYLRVKCSHCDPDFTEGIFRIDTPNPLLIELIQGFALEVRTPRGIKIPVALTVSQRIDLLNGKIYSPLIPRDPIHLQSVTPKSPIHWDGKKFSCSQCS